MTDIAELHAQALDATGRIVAGIPADRWHADTPCGGWDVRALVNHVVSGNLWAAELAAGRTIEDVGDRLDGDVLGADPARLVRRVGEGRGGGVPRARRHGRAVCGLLRPGSRVGVRGAPVPRRLHPRLGPGRSLPARTPHWTPVSCKPARTSSSRKLEAFRGAGAFAGPLPVPPGATGQARFLAMLGRAG